MKFKPFKKILVANRGEIACRMFTAARFLGMKTVAVYSEADANALHVQSADESVLLGPGPANESYLHIEKIIKAAKDTGAEAIHPGYGFLSEREQFAKAVLDAGLTWIGPSPEVIELMGNKVAAKLAAEKAKVPTLPWAQLKSGWKLEDLKTSAKKVGYPLLLKAAAGGGGRGMRLVEKDDELEEKATAAAREAEGSFGSAEIFMERYCPIAKHIEVQIFGDSKGNVKIFGERDCSAQRRHQKVVEESPAPALKDSVRKTLWESAERLAKSVGYVNAGTLEFLMDPNDQVYFLEMNTRLQVEHPVSELVWGVDLPVLQLLIAQGNAMEPAVLNASPRGHAIEVRIYAEDPSKGYLPTPGTITDFYFPVVPGIRVDTGFQKNSEVTMFYDAMLAKVIAYGANREEARLKLIQALERSNVSGVAWNKNFLIDILQTKTFIEAKTTIQYLGEAFKAWKGVVRTSRESGSTDEDGGEIEMKSKAYPSPWNYYGSKNPKKLSPPKGISLQSKTADDTSASNAADGPLVAEYPGKVLKVNVKAGDSVTENQVVIVCESMKMEFNYSAPKNTKIKSIHVKAGDLIKAGATLVEWES